MYITPLGELNQNMGAMIHAMMPDYSKEIKITLPYTATEDGYVFLIVVSTGSGQTIYIDGKRAAYTGQTISSGRVEGGQFVPIAKGQTISGSGAMGGGGSLYLDTDGRLKFIDNAGGVHILVWE